MSAKLDKAIEAVLQASKPQGCWASHLDGDAKKFVARLREEEAKGVKIGRKPTQRVLREAFDLRVSEDSIRSHLTGVCRCEQ